MSLTIYCISKTGTNEVYISDIRQCQHVELVNNEIEICHIRREFIEYGNENMTQTKDSVPYKQFPAIQTFEYNSEIDNVDPNQSLTFSYGLSQNAITYGQQKENQTLRRS